MAAYKDENGTWYSTFYIKDWQGKRIRKKKRGFKTKKEALQWEASFISQEDGSMKIKLKDFVEVYFKDKAHELKERSIINKRYMIETRVIPYLGDREMNSITSADIIKWQNTIREFGFQPTYERMLNNQVNALFNHACKIYGLKSSPCAKVKKMGRSEANRLDFWTKEEYEQFIAVVDKNDIYYIMFEILFWTGCREGELLALTPADVDVNGKTVNINKTYFRRGDRDIITEPKTENSVRTVTIPKFLADELREFLSRLYKHPENARLFPMTARALQVAFKKYTAKAGLREIRDHDLRHSHASMLINQGVQPLLIKERLGHGNIKITLDTYGHLYPNKQQELADMLNSKR